MKRITRLFLSALASFSLATALHAESWSVFNFKGSNPAGTMQGVLVLNRDAVRTTTETGYSFETPVYFLHYKVSGSSGILSEFTLSADNPNVLTITKGADGSTQFMLLVEPVPADPPGNAQGFFMSFTFEGEAPWGDSVPDRTITEATDFLLGSWIEIYDQSVSVDEVRISELARQLGSLNAELRKIRKHLANGQK